MTSEQLFTQSQKEQLGSLGIVAVYLFGSTAEGKSHSLSDLDLGVLLRKDPQRRVDFNLLYIALYDLFTDVFPGKALDIVFLDRAGLEIAFDAVAHGEILFEHSPEERLELEERITLLYADFRPLLSEFDANVLQRIE